MNRGGGMRFSPTRLGGLFSLYEAVHKNRAVQPHSPNQSPYFLPLSMQLMENNAVRLLNLHLFPIHHNAVVFIIYPEKRHRIGLMV